MPGKTPAAMANAAMRRIIVTREFNRMRRRKDLKLLRSFPRLRESSVRMIATRGLAGQALDCRAAAAELVFQPLKAAVEVIDAVDDGLAFGGERGDDERHRGAQIGRHHRRAFERLDTFDGGAFAIKLDARAEPRQLLHVHEAVLEHRLDDM